MNLDNANTKNVFDGIITVLITDIKLELNFILNDR